MKARTTSTRSSSGARRPGSTPSGPETGPVHIKRLGADADGIAHLPGGDTLYLPFTLPGETVQPGPLTRRGQGWSGPVTILDPSPERRTPPCPHFGSCGGCTLQHWDDAAYAAWKLGLVAETAAALGYTGPIPLHRTPPGTRRRMDLAITRGPHGLRLGLHAARSAVVTDITTCPVLHPTLQALIPALRPVLSSLSAIRREASLIVNLLDSGPDLLLRTDGPLIAPDRTKLTEFARAHRLPRISWAQGPRDTPEPACLLRPATQMIGGHTTAIPPGAFLQAAPQGEDAIRAAILAGLVLKPGKAPIIELFAGIGTLTHALSAQRRVLAYEGDAAATQALRTAGNPRITATCRDLARQPLTSAELKPAAAIVLDPPYAGAPAQMPGLATCTQPILYVSCNPAALRRDGQALRTGGYRLTAITAIDQFLWSARIEAVAVFTRA